MNQMCIYTTAPKPPCLHERHCAVSIGAGAGGRGSIAVKGTKGVQHSGC